MRCRCDITRRETRLHEVYCGWHPVSRAVCFPGVGAPPRTNENFRGRACAEHHKETSPLEKLLHFDMVLDVIIADRLHLIDLGVMRKFLQAYVFGLFGAEQWSADDLNAISRELENIALPSEIHRKFRKLHDIKYWKGSEYSSFLHYASLVVLQDRISPEAYNHFMLFFCAVTILSSKFYKRLWPVAGQMLKHFVADFAKIYGEGYISSNIHNLLHVASEVEDKGPLNTMTAYPFENALQLLKLLIRSGWKNLEQVINRLSELEIFNAPEENESFNYKIQGKGNNVTLHC